MTEQNIGTCIRMAMEKKGTNVKDLAEKLGKSVQTVHSYRKGRCPDIRILTEIAEFCDMTFDELMKLAD